MPLTVAHKVPFEVVRVVNVVKAKSVCSAICGRREQVLSDAQIDQIARLLDERCRDVVD